tara:strand:- start:175 stop:414 length:240 start_codon:yes stop_codon:yes gene_type:complete
MDDPIVVKKGPFVIDVEEGKKYFWCSCGLSNKQPFCDSSHKGTNFRSVFFQADKNKKIFFCGCKKTSNPPFCDGTHKKL